MKDNTEEERAESDSQPSSSWVNDLGITLEQVEVSSMDVLASITSDFASLLPVKSLRFERLLEKQSTSAIRGIILITNKRLSGIVTLTWAVIMLIAGTLRYMKYVKRHPELKADPTNEIIDENVS